MTWGRDWWQQLWKSLKDNSFYLIIVISSVLGLLRLLIHTEFIVFDWTEAYEVTSCIWVGILIATTIFKEQYRTIALICIIIIMFVELTIYWVQT